MNDSDIVSTPPAPSSPENSSVATTDFWPDINVNKLREQINLGGEIPHERLVEAIVDGVVFVVGELTEWKAAQEGAGADTLAGVAPTDTVGDATRLEHLFLAAVSAYAAARLAERNPDLTATKEGSDRADQRREMAADFMAACTRSIRQIKGKCRTNAELI